MVDIVEVADKIFRFETPVSFALYPPTVYVIREAEAVLIEPGPSATIPVVREALEYLDIKNLAYIIPTHVHMDHAGGAGTLARFFPGAKVLVHPRGAKHAVDPSRLIQGVKMVWGDDFEARFGAIDSVVESQVTVPDDGEVIPIGERELQIIYAPGHAPHHMVIFDRKVKGLFCGEALGLPYSQLPAVAPMSFDLETYLETIDKLQRLKLGTRMIFYSHGGVELEPDALMARAAENACVYGDMVLKALKAGEAHDTIVSRVAEQIAAHHDLDVDMRGVGITVAGYTIYFKSKGLI
jgi:glyoxylase-like metal-dependent hydrolase (beta-lactamase superfamily II)